MPSYLGGRKVQALFYGEKRVKEAWYNGEQIYRFNLTTWKDKTSYRKYSSVWVDGVVYMCLREHISNAVYSRPKTGSAWTDYWQKI